MRRAPRGRWRSRRRRRGGRSTSDRGRAGVARGSCGGSTRCRRGSSPPPPVDSRSWRNSSPPTVPTPSRKTLSRVGSKNASCTVASARRSSAEAMASEMLSSEEPCAMARTLTPAAPNELKMRPEMPGRRHMSTPTMARIETSSSTTRSSTSPAARSRANSALTTSRAAAARCGSTAMQMECSLEACEMRMTLMPASPSALKKRPAVPGTSIMPSPSMRSRATREIDEMPRIGASEGPASASTTVPGNDGIEGVLDQERDRRLARRMHRGRIDHLGAEVRELEQLVVGQSRQRERGLDPTRIRRQHAVDVGPDLDPLGTEGHAEERRRVVGAAAPERRGLAVEGRADEAGDDLDARRFAKCSRMRA